MRCVMISLGIIAIMLGFGLTVGSFYYGDQFGEIRSQQMRVAGPMVTLHGWVIVGACVMRAIAKNYDIHDIRIIGEVPFVKMPYATVPVGR